MIPRCLLLGQSRHPGHVCFHLIAAAQPEVAPASLAASCLRTFLQMGLRSKRENIKPAMRNSLYIGNRACQGYFTCNMMW